MAVEAPDPRTFRSWEDAFQYPIPVVRKLEQQLRANLNENQERLRALVGASYRDLLGTAERIIEMDEKMQQAEDILGNLGQKCNSARLDRVHKNYARLEHQHTQKNAERFSLASQLAVLQACQDLIRRLLTRKGSPLLPAKLLVLSRLLHKSLSQLPGAPPFVEAIRTGLGSLRRMLLNRIDQALSSPDMHTTQLLEGMCAFSLATTSTPSDILRYFHQVKLEAITESVSNKHASSRETMKAFKIYISTLRDTADVAHVRLADRLAKLEIRPLLQDSDVRALDGLNLGVHERWLPDEVKHFTPWQRHDELQKPEADRLVHTWAKQALSVFLDGTESSLNQRYDFESLLDLRRELVETLLSSRIPTAGLGLMKILGGVRSTLVSQFVRMSRDRSDNLQLIASQISELVAEWSSDTSLHSVPSLWEPSLQSMELGHGANEFIHTVVNRRHGRTSSVLRVIRAYETWAKSIDDAYRIIVQMRNTKWDLDFLDDEEELQLESTETALTEDDPREVEQALAGALRSALSRMEDSLRNIILELDESPQQGEKAIFLIRALREIRQRLSSSLWKFIPQAAQDFGLTLNPDLHGILVSHVFTQPWKNFSHSIDRFVVSQNMPIRALWAGTPALPVQPSPAVFKFLYTLVKRMAGCGGDLWASGAVHVWKVTLRNNLGNVLSKAIERLQKSNEEVKMDGHKKSEAQRDTEGEHDNIQVAEPMDSGEEASDRVDSPPSLLLARSEQATLTNSNEPPVELLREKLIQIFFDALYLRRALALPQDQSHEHDALSVVAQSLEDGALVDAAGLERLNKASTEYWKKTYLLFALLA